MADLAHPVLDEAEHHHLARVRRLRAGDPLILGDGAGGWVAARFRDREPELAGEPCLAPRPVPMIEVGFALVKGAKPELVVQKLVELGVDHVRPFVAGRSVVRWDAAKAAAAHERWTKVAREAAQQSRRPWLAEVAPLAGFAEVAALPGACRADRDGAALSLDRPLVLVGPEGGWDPQELAHPLPTVGLGPNVLRAETAAIAAGVLLSAQRAGLLPAR